MTCKECFHYAVCATKGKHANYQVKNGKQYLVAFENPVNCKHFKDRSKFIELPCKLGDDIYYFDSKGNIYKQRIFQFVYGGTGLKVDSDVMFDSDLLGKRFFRTKEEAEQALKEREKE